MSIISNENKVVDFEKFKEDFDKLKCVSVDGVMIDCWWGIVEGVIF